MGVNPWYSRQEIGRQQNYLKEWAAIRHSANQPAVPYDFFISAFNQEKALLGAFSVITNLRMELFEAQVDTPGQ